MRPLRAALLAVLPALATPGRLLGQTPPAAEVARALRAGASTQQRWLEPLQGHAGPEVYQIAAEPNPSVDAYVGEMGAARLGWLRVALDRSELYRSYIMGLIERFHLPTELIHLPLIESEYSPWVVSSSGAAGLWQFMPNSIASFGIRIDDLVDERRDFWKSSEAALRKLRDNYAHFGDWLLALAAYNCGAGRLDRIITQTGIRDFWLLREGGYLPPETARFVPKFLGVTRVASYAGRHGLDADWDTAVLWDRIRLERAVNIELLCAVTGAPLALLERANAELHYSVTPDGDAGYWLKVPLDLHDAIAGALSDSATTLMEYHVHVVRTGDTLYSLGRTFGVGVDLIQRHNVGVDPRSLRIGSKLFIPLVGQTQPDQLLAPEDAHTPPPLADTYAVRPGDTLWALSRKYGVTVEDLAAGNGLSTGAVLRPGALLKVPDMSIMTLDE